MTHPSTTWSADDPPALRASRHKQTRALRFPPVSPASVLADAYETVPLPARGTVYSFTVIHPNPKSGAAPFALGYVDLAGPARLFGRITGDGVAIGAACEAVPDAEFGYAFHTIRG